MFKILLKERNFLLIICILAFLSRVGFLDQRGFAGDEKYSLLVSQFLVQEGGNQPESLRNLQSPYFTPQQFWSERTLDDFLESIARRENGSGSLYFLMLHYWSNLFGLDDATLRLPSLFFSILLLPILFHFTKKHFSFTFYTPYFVTIAALVSPFYFNYSLIARNYSMTFTWILLATYFFLNLLKSERFFWKESSFWLYSLCLLLSLFGHHSSVIVLPLHVAILLISRRFTKFFPLGFAMVLPVVGLLLWSLSEGGMYSFDAIQNSKIQYLEIAQKGTDEMVKFTTFETISRQFWAVFSYLYLPISGMADKIEGIQNTIICLLSAATFFVAIGIVKSTKLRIILFVLAFFPAMFFYSYSVVYFSLTAIALSFLFVFLQNYFKNFNSLEWQTVTLMAFAPLVFLVIFALMDGVTMRINPRYAGFGYPFLLLVVVVVLELFWKKYKQAGKLLIGIYVGIVLAFVLLPEWQRIIKDESPKYFHHVVEKRLPNPYRTLADEIVENYAVGDTVLYCSQRLGRLSGTATQPDFSLQDAQYTTIYLPKKASFIQRGDTTETDKVFLWKKAQNRKILLMDLSDKRY